MAQMMTAMAGKGMRERMQMAQQLQSGMMQNPNGQLMRKKQGTGKRLSSKTKKANRKALDKLRRQKKRKRK